MQLLPSAWSFSERARTSSPLELRSARVGAAVLVAVALAAPQLTGAQSRPIPDTFIGTTANMVPAGVGLKIDVLEWSGQAARAAVAAALEAENVADALKELPSAGYVWIDDSPVGYPLKYAYRTTDDAGRERVTFVTTPVLGAYGLDAWTPAGASAAQAYDYSVIELRIGKDSDGVGTLSLAAEVSADGDAQIVSLDWDGSGPLIIDAARQDPPYWARGS